MKNLILILSIILLASFGDGGGYNIGDKATDFMLKNVDGKMVSLSQYDDAKGFVVIFTCNHCPFAVAYEDRIIEIDKKYKELGYPVIAINPNDISIVPGDSYENMVERAKEEGFTFPYLRDESQEVADAYGAMKTPHVYLLHKEDKDLIVKYIGTIDDNHKDAAAVTKTYLTDAIDALIAGKTPNPATTKAIGCSVKRKS